MREMWKCGNMEMWKCENENEGVCHLKMTVPKLQSR